jgi:lysophospholipase L1-like esterase
MRPILVVCGMFACTPETTVVPEPGTTIPSDPAQPTTPVESPTTPPVVTTPTTPPVTTTPGTTTASPFDLCFSDIADPTQPTPDYDQFAPLIGSHCSGTNHQDITGVQRVVFLGDSVTVGTPPTAADEFYRNLVAQELATTFGLEAPGELWQRIDLFNGASIVEQSGDFWSCAHWGDRADDLLQDGTQLEDCFPEETRDLVTLVVMTVGGNDLASLQEGFQEALPIDDLWAQTDEFTALVRESVAWMTDPARFPNGNHVVMTNLYEYTDATGEVTACPGAELAGYTDTTDPALQDMVVSALEDYMSISVDHGVDLVFLLETFCGHGYNREDPNGRCYRGPGAELWFDLTCIHPNPAGHAVLADLVMDVVLE